MVISKPRRCITARRTLGLGRLSGCGSTIVEVVHNLRNASATTFALLAMWEAMRALSRGSPQLFRSSIRGRFAGLLRSPCGSTCSALHTENEPRARGVPVSRPLVGGLPLVGGRSLRRPTGQRAAPPWVPASLCLLCDAVRQKAEQRRDACHPWRRTGFANPDHGSRPRNVARRQSIAARILLLLFLLSSLSPTPSRRDATKRAPSLSSAASCQGTHVKALGAFSPKACGLPVVCRPPPPRRRAPPPRPCSSAPPRTPGLPLVSLPRAWSLCALSRLAGSFSGAAASRSF